MKNNIETLRAICFTADDMENITNLGDLFSEKDIEFMVEFKKIYELGLTQMEKFIDKLDEEGDELDTYSILYYVEVLVNGPLGVYAREYATDNEKKYFGNTPDILGILGNKTRSHQNNTIHEDGEYSLGCSVDQFNRLPPFMQESLSDAIKGTEDVFRSSLKSSSEIDNTLPLADKNPQLRYAEESSGEFVLRSNASYMIKDAYFYLAVDDKSQDIFEKVQETLGEEIFRIYKDKKQYSPFDSEKNTSESVNSKVEKKYIETVDDEEIERVITLDLMGDEFDSEDARSSKLKVAGVEKDEEFKLHTNEGQLSDKGES